MKKILILSANPKDTSKLRLDEEVREIEAGLERCKYREEFQIISKWAMGEGLARENEIQNAVAKFQEALKFDPSLDINPQIKAQKLAAEGLVSKASSLVREKKIKEAITTYNQAQKLDPQVEIDANAWNSLCWQGSLDKLAKEVMFACEKAVKLAPDSGNIRNSRGLARALTGDYKGAIADFEAYIAQTGDEDKAQRQGWVKVLREGKNPFTEEVLEKLRSEE